MVDLSVIPKLRIFMDPETVISEPTRTVHTVQFLITLPKSNYRVIQLYTGHSMNWMEPWSPILQAWVMSGKPDHLATCIFFLKWAEMGLPSASMEISQLGCLMIRENLIWRVLSRLDYGSTVMIWTELFSEVIELNFIFPMDLSIPRSELMDLGKLWILSFSRWINGFITFFSGMETKSWFTRIRKKWSHLLMRRVG